ncbi:hypothetical protein AG1IA_09075 [Rhizoctonia solani AG-1 IA]|uniref:Uncharacterized protein n=1 Tax=Thanatephorus cucumeris (strain AG1-IA) TaxID=983506 RepID=L8WG12_THACA|nr:hypothetical protein AG1IA_09075 [Rhizoctonia solani AG-1 IA]
MSNHRNPSQESVVGEKQEIIEIEHSPVVHDEAAPSTSRPRKSTGGHGDAALAILGTSDTPVEISPEQDAAVLRKVDRWLVPVMLMVYFLQQLDKWLVGLNCLCGPAYLAACLVVFSREATENVVPETYSQHRASLRSLRCLWMAMNGVTSMFGSLIAFGIGHIHGSLKPYQLQPMIPTSFVLPDSPSTAKFLSQEEKVIALERLRANNQGRSIDTVPYHPFGAFQVIITLGSAAIATKLKLKWPVLFFLTLPPIAGASALYVLGREPELRNELLGCYYVVSSCARIVATSLKCPIVTAIVFHWYPTHALLLGLAKHGRSHKEDMHYSKTTGLIYVAQCIVGPLLYKTTDAPYYHRGLIAKQVASEPAPDYLLIYDPHLSSLICWIILAVLTPVTALYLAFLNKQHASARRRAGKKAEVIDTSLEDSKHARQAAKENEKSDGDESEGTKRRLNDQHTGCLASGNIVFLILLASIKGENRASSCAGVLVSGDVCLSLYGVLPGNMIYLEHSERITKSLYGVRSDSPHIEHAIKVFTRLMNGIEPGHVPGGFLPIPMLIWSTGSSEISGRSEVRGLQIHRIQKRTGGAIPYVLEGQLEYSLGIPTVFWGHDRSIRKSHQHRKGFLQLGQRKRTGFFGLDNLAESDGRFLPPSQAEIGDCFPKVFVTSDGWFATLFHRYSATLLVSYTIPGATENPRENEDPPAQFENYRCTYAGS